MKLRSITAFVLIAILTFSGCGIIKSDWRYKPEYHTPEELETLYFTAAFCAPRRYYMRRAFLQDTEFAIAPQL